MGRSGTDAARTVAAAERAVPVKKNVRGLRTRKKLVDAAASCFA